APWQLVAGRAAMGLFGGYTSLALGLVAIAAPRQRVTFAVGLVQTGQIVGNAIGPAFGGFAAEHYGVRGSFVVAAVLTSIAAGLIVVALPAVRAAAAETTTSTGAKGLGALWATLTLPGFAAILGILLVARAVERTFDPVLPLYVAQLQSSGVAVMTGFIATAGALATATASVTVSRLTRRWSAHRLLAFALLAGALSCLPIAFATSSWQLLLFRVVWGLLAGGVLTLAFATGGVLLPPERRASAFGLLGSATFYGGALGPMLSGAVATVHLTAIFWVDALLYLAALGGLLAASGARIRQSSLRLR
ncbi:MAG: MFS transporter, partial [Chloroflexi bacterium]|nr:MFS transporter [Chloroflexota bacterium]